MKILHVIRDLSPETGGPVSAIRGLSAKQRQLGHEVAVVSTDYGLQNGGDLIEEGYEISTCTFAPWRYAPGMIDVLNRKMKWCDIVHIHTLWEYPTLLAARLARKAGKPFLLRPCGMLEAWSMSQSTLKKRLYLALFGRTLFAPPCLLHFTTQAERQKSIAPFNPDSVVIENGISEHAFKASPAGLFLDRFPELQGRKIILFLGRVHPKKRPDVAVRAFARVSKAFPDSVLMLAGPCTASYRGELMAIAAGEGITNRLFFTGILQGNVLSGAFSAATMFLLPSMQENFGIAVAEAMAASCPVIISEHVGIKDYIEEGNAGVICAAEVGPFADAIERLLSMPQLARRMGENGRAVALKHFTWDRAAKRLDRVYEGHIR